MPGCSLWLVPPKGSPAYDVLSALITRSLPAQFPGASPPAFAPHVTLASDIAPSVFSHAADELQQKKDAQAWLNSLDPPLPRGSNVSVQFEALDVGEKFVQKLTLRVRKEGVRGLALRSRLAGVEKDADQAAAEHWVDQTYGPHCSLVYGDMPIADEKRIKLQELIESAGVSIDGTGDLGGWTGGVVWLVPTFKKIPEWESWAELPL